MLSEFIQKKRLGTLLLEKKLVSQDQLEWALLKQRETKSMLGEILVEAGFISEDVLSKILAIQFGVPFIQEKDIQSNTELMARVPLNLLKMKKFIPLKLDAGNGILTIIVSDPNNFVLLDHVKNVLGYHVKYVLASSSAISRNIEAFLQSETVSKEQQPKEPKNRDVIVERVTLDDDTTLDTIKSSSRKPLDENFAPALIHSVLAYAVSSGVEQIHSEPMEEGGRIRFRINNRLTDIVNIRQDAMESYHTRLKIMSGLSARNNTLFKQGIFTVDINFDNIEFELTVLPSQFGESCVVRVVSDSGFITSIDDLGFDDRSLRSMKKFLKTPGGICILGSSDYGAARGVLQSMAAQLDPAFKKILSIESEISRKLPGIHQMSLADTADDKKVETLMKMFKCLKSFRPDSLIFSAFDIFSKKEKKKILDELIGLSSRGIKVVLFTGARTFKNLAYIFEDLDVLGNLLLNNTNLIVIQEKVYTVCPECKLSLNSEKARGYFESAGLNFTPFSKITHVLGKGCVKCHKTGLSKGISIFESYDVTQEMEEAFAAGKTLEQIRRQALERGMRTMKASALDKARKQELPITELIRVLKIV